MTLDELKILYHKIEENNISLEVAKEKLFTGKRAWHEKDWAERKEKFLQSKCEQCGRTENLIVQHFWHPRKYGEYKYDAIIKYREIFTSETPIEKLVSMEDIQNYVKKFKQTSKSICPICGYSYRERKIKTPRFICTKCKHEFDVPLEVAWPTFIDDLNNPIKGFKPYEVSFSSIRQQLYVKKRKEAVMDIYGLEIEREALLNYIKDSIRYQSFEDAKTWCKRCAFNYDKNQADLCPVCKKNYKKFWYDKCRKCAEKETEKELDAEVPYDEKCCSTCEFCMPVGDKMVCAGGTKDGPYGYGDEIIDESKVCDNWEPSILGMF
ncbi:MAG: hypothetical protein GX962_09650 [Epulopiscium sp.]|nr:hypothetical protein [Candidatus Epulonipiscium sp.]